MSAAFNPVMSMAPVPMDPPMQSHPARPSMRRKSSAQNLLSSFKPSSSQGTGTVSSATGVQFAQIASAATSREWDVQSLSLQNESAVSIGGDCGKWCACCVTCEQRRDVEGVGEEEDNHFDVFEECARRVSLLFVLVRQIQFCQS